MPLRTSAKYKFYMDLELTSDDIVILLESLEDSLDLLEDEKEIDEYRRLYDKLFKAFHELNPVEQ